MTTQWEEICKLNDLVPGTGVCALHNGEQVALFRPANDSQVYAISNYDPIGKANVLSRGITGDIKGKLVVASPLYKQHFELTSGECLEEPEIKLATYQVKVEGDKVLLAV
ncbi:nitrite reductase small subunit NirD [Gayadomonas joobiniege]|uniref:nitrite reductase small subunit NirD n=1 Tax=Gayadomonas joobiniege TaxID=1234606 RepID=UPI0003640B36|nr:nitrite reductase small subunit NirD [Gayadomonas joobiniege]